LKAVENAAAFPTTFQQRLLLPTTLRRQLS
jgi:hypothetical protein